MKTAFLLTAAAIAALAAPQAHASSKAFNLSGFDKISASSHVTVIVRQGPYSVQVSEPEGRFGDLILEVRGSTLVASRQPKYGWVWDWGWGRDQPEYTITVSAPAWSQVEAYSHAGVSLNVAAPALTVTASDHASVSGAISSPALTLTVSSHANVTGTLAGQAVVLRASDHAGVRLSGQCASIEIAASAHADVEGQGLKCDTARIEAMDHAGVQIWAARQAQARASSHADIQVYGQPSSLQQTALDHASVNRR